MDANFQKAALVQGLVHAYEPLGRIIPSTLRPPTLPSVEQAWIDEAASAIGGGMPIPKQVVALPAPFYGARPDRNTEGAASARQYVLPEPLSLASSAYGIKTGIPDLSELTERYTGCLSGLETDWHKASGLGAQMAVFRKYLHLIPFSEKTAFSLYDYARLMLATAVSLSKSPLRQLQWIQGDISGIQPFIFDIPSRKAAKELKARSFFLQMITDAVTQYIGEEYGVSHHHVVVNTGGNFSILVPALEDHAAYASRIRKKISTWLQKERFHVAVAFSEPFEASLLQDFGTMRHSVMEAIGQEKQRKRSALEASVLFEPFSTPAPTDFSPLMKELVHAKGYRWVRGAPQPEAVPSSSNSAESWSDKLHALGSGWEWEFQTATPEVFFNKTQTHQEVRFAVKDVPIWKKSLLDDPVVQPLIAAQKQKEAERAIQKNEPISAYADPNTVIELGMLAQMAKCRTGTDNIAVLKLDVDDLGALFMSHRIEKSTGSLSSSHREHVLDKSVRSRAMQWFFEGYVNTLLGESFCAEPFPATYRDQLYPIFAGGDDSFLVGAWDAVLDFAHLMQKAFTRFTQNPDVTLSAGVVMVHAHFPVYQFSNMAEAALENAKRYPDAKQPTKNAISIFGHVLSWEDYKKAHVLKNKLVAAVKTTDSRAILERIQLLVADTQTLMDEIKTSDLPIRRLWKLKYGLRNMKDHALRKEIGDAFERLALEAFSASAGSLHRHSDPIYMSVAARWAEFETRNLKENKHGHV